MTSTTLVCAECGNEDTGTGIGWRAYLTADEGEEPVEAVVLCPACVEREFGESRGSAR